MTGGSDNQSGPMPAGRMGAARPLRAGLALLLALTLLAAIGAGESRAKAVVSPGPTAKNASVWSEISIRGIRSGQAGRIIVRGSRSGPHGFVKRSHGDGRGFSLLMKRRFAVSENVQVSTRFGIYGARGGSYSFRTENKWTPRAGRVAPRPKRSFGSGYVSRPDLAPPTMEITTNSAEAGNDLLFVGSKDSGASIYAADGEPVWYRPGGATDLRPGVWRGKPVLTWVEVPSKGSGLTRNTYMIADSKYRIIRRLTPGNGYSADIHEFRPTSRGTAWITAYRIRNRDLRAVGQGRNGRVMDSIAQELDLKTGRVIWEWHSLDHVPVTETYATKVKRAGNPFDYFHINTVSDAPDGNVFISGRSTNTAYKVSRRTGRVIWRLGGKRSTFRMGKGARFSWQHDTELLPGNRVSIYDNGNSPVASRPWRNQSRGVILKLNSKKRTATVVRNLFNPAAPLASTQGNLQSLADGGYLVGWGGVPLISQHAADGTLLFNARIKGINSFYRAYRGGWDGRPTGRPTLVAKPGNAAGRTRFWVSHNGDTATQTWRVFAGDDRNALTHVAEIPRNGFETTAVVETAGPWIQLRGFDSEGKATGWSPIIAVGQ